MRRISASSVNRASWSKSMAMVLNEGGGVRTFGDAVEPDDSDVRRRAQAEIGQPAHDVECDVMVFSKHPMSNATRDRYAGKVDFVTAEELYRR